MLYDRDFNILSESEIEEYEIAKAYYEKYRNKLGVSPKVHVKYRQMRPEASYFFESLFPNNYLSTYSLSDNVELKRTEEEFKGLIDSSPSERQILNFINSNRYYNLIASIFHGNYTFGHHEAYLFKEFEITSTYKADYLLVGKNSHGYHFVFIELENPDGSITNSDGSFGSTLRKGIKQVEDWDRWIESNFYSLQLIFEKYKKKGVVLPDEFRSLNKSRLNYVVVAGRRKHFNEYTYEEKRRLLRSRFIDVLHYDNLIDYYSTFYSTKRY